MNTHLALVITSLLIFCATSRGAEPSANDSVTEFRGLVAISPQKRTAMQTQRLRELWRSTEALKSREAWFEVLQVGDSVLTFPGLIIGRSISYDPASKEYTISAISPSRTHEEDIWDRAIIASEDWIVLRKRTLKVNSR